MKAKNSTPIAMLSVAALSLLAPHITRAASVVVAQGGDFTPASITPARDQFRTNIGGGTTAGANPGQFGTQRREINWDAVAPAASAPNLLAANFFNTTSPRGAVFSTPGTGFEVSGATTDGGAGQPAAANFGNINASYTAAFGTFSAQRLFTALGSNITDVTFFVAGTTTVATVSGFGAVFTDVETLNGTKLEFFTPANVSLGVFNVPIGTTANASLSFLGVSFNAGELVGRVRITSGTAALGAAVNDNPGGGTDLVVMDDFIYSEPVPEPSALVLLAAGMTGFLARRKRNSRD